MPQPVQVPNLLLLSSPDWEDYALLDSGGGLKLERFGQYRLVRPEPEAMWKAALPEKEWKMAQGVFQPSSEELGGHWVSRVKLPDWWQLHYKEMRFKVRTTASRHVGVFPEQAGQWDWIAEQVRAAGRPVRVLNLFGYTGLATLAATSAGASVTHLDASRKAIAWARENMQLSGLGDRPVRWIVDDAMKFVQREARRQARYDGLILDPPKFGRGPKGEVWEFYRLIPALLQACRAVLSERPCFVVLTAYAVKASAVTLYYAMQEMMAAWQGTVSAGEVVLNEESAGRRLSMAIFSRWKVAS